MLAHLVSNKDLSPTVTELSFRGRKLNISLVFVSQSHFEMSKTIRLNATNWFNKKIPNKSELQK